MRDQPAGDIAARGVCDCKSCEREGQLSNCKTKIHMPIHLLDCGKPLPRKSVLERSFQHHLRLFGNSED
jgi:hypothetical protein